MKRHPALPLSDRDFVPAEDVAAFCRIMRHPIRLHLFRALLLHNGPVVIRFRKKRKIRTARNVSSDAKAGGVPSRPTLILPVGQARHLKRMRRAGLLYLEKEGEEKEQQQQRKRKRWPRHQRYVCRVDWERASDFARRLTGHY